MTVWSPVKRTAMHYQHVSLGATMADYDGWQRPSRYTSSEEELQHIRQAGGLSDISPIGKYYIQGEDVPATLERLLPEAASLGIKRAAVSSLSGPTGPTKDRLVVCRLTHDEVFITSSSSLGEVGPVTEAFKERITGCAHMVDMTSNYAAVNVVGPQSVQLLTRLTDLNISSHVFPDLSCTHGKLAEVYAIIVRRDQRELPSYDVYVGRDFGEHLWEAMLEAGHGLGIAPVGIEALKQLAGGGG